MKFPGIKRRQFLSLSLSFSLSCFLLSFFFRINNLMAAFCYLPLRRPHQTERWRLHGCVQRLINMDSILISIGFLPARSSLSSMVSLVISAWTAPDSGGSFSCPCMMQASAHSGQLTSLWAELPQQRPLLWGQETAHPVFSSHDKLWPSPGTTVYTA